MDTQILIIIVVVIVLIAVAAVAAFAFNRRRKSAHIEQKFGPEYERAVEHHGGRREAERELAERERRRSKLDIRPLDPAARERYAAAWRRTQATFVDSPPTATREADLLVAEVMRDRGYPMDDFEQRAADVSVDHPDVVDHYRSAHGVSVANDNGEASTEQLREAMVHYRELFDRLLGDPQENTANEEARR